MRRFAGAGLQQDVVDTKVLGFTVPTYDGVFLQEALACAREQKCRLLELRAALSLGRLWAIRGEPQQAQGLLAPIYAEYTEGFDTADLKDARTFLEEIQQ